MEKQRVGGRGKMAKTEEPPGRSSVATEPERSFCVCAPAKLAMEASEPRDGCTSFSKC